MWGYATETNEQSVSRFTKSGGHDSSLEFLLVTMIEFEMTLHRLTWYPHQFLRASSFWESIHRMANARGRVAVQA